MVPHLKQLLRLAKLW
uniref:Uncharacterized protein n=1 Tax=Arundo donax TaxID=35708 RepID=A0A0A9EE80_ARUDO